MPVRSGTRDATIGTTGTVSASNSSPPAVTAPAPKYAPDGGASALTGIDGGERNPATGSLREVSQLVPLKRTEEIAATLTSMTGPWSAPSWREPRRMPEASGDRAAGDEQPGTASERELQEAMVLAVLEQYAQAYDRLDVQAVKAVFPTQDVRSLQNLFHGLDAQRLRFATCGVVSMTGQAANAHCQGNITYQPRVGAGRRLPVTWNFDLSRHEDGWHIVNAATIR